MTSLTVFQFLIGNLITKKGDKKIRLLGFVFQFLIGNLITTTTKPVTQQQEGFNSL